jgi:hypothetical protein
MLGDGRGTRLATPLDMTSETQPSEPSRLAALRVWQSVWAGIERLVSEAREALGSHLREGALDARRLTGDPEREIGELIIGRTRLRVECMLECAPTSPAEAVLYDVFGSDKPLVRIRVLREAANGSSVLESLLAVEPASGLWIATELDLGPAHLDDLASFEAFFWTLITDRGPRSATRELPTG